MEKLPVGCGLSVLNKDAQKMPLFTLQYLLKPMDKESFPKI